MTEWSFVAKRNSPVLRKVRGGSRRGGGGTQERGTAVRSSEVGGMSEAREEGERVVGEAERMGDRVEFCGEEKQAGAPGKFEVEAGWRRRNSGQRDSCSLKQSRRYE